MRGVMTGQGQRLRALIAATIAVGVLGGIWWLWDAEDALTRVRRLGVIRIGYAPEPPYAIPQPSGEATGESPEVARRVARELGIGRIEWVQTPFGSLVGDLEAGRYDLVASGLFITPERSRRVAFSCPTVRVHHALLIRRRHRHGLRTAADWVADPSRSLAVISETVEGPQLLRWGLSPRQLIQVPDSVSARAAVLSDSVDGTALSCPTARWLERQDAEGRLLTVTPFLPEPGATPRPIYAGFAFRRQDRHLREAFDAALGRFLATAEHRELVAPFGFTAENLPDRASAEEALNP